MFNYPMSFMSSTGVATNLSYANFPFSGVLPTMYTNFGGDLQCTTIEPYGGYNFGVLFNPIASQTYGVPSMFANNFMTTPPDVSAAAAAQASQILTPIYNNMASGQINSASQLLNCAKTKLEAKLNDENTSAEEKQEIQQVLDKLKALEDKLNTLKESTDLDPQTAFEQAKAITDEITKTLKDAQNAAAKRENAAQASEQENAPAADSNPQTQQSQGTGSASESEESQGADNQDATPQGAAQSSGSITDGSIDNFPMVIQNTVDDFFNAIDGAGTKDSKMEEILDTYTQDSQAMTGLMLCWNEKYSAIHNESFIEAFMDDAGHGQAKKYCPKIINALVDQAKQLGIYNSEFRAYADAAKKEIFNSGIFGMNDGKVCQNIDAMLELVGRKYNSQFATKS